jgi:hypothetical protein
MPLTSPGVPARARGGTAAHCKTTPTDASPAGRLPFTVPRSYAPPWRNGLILLLEFDPPKHGDTQVFLNPPFIPDVRSARQSKPKLPRHIT